MDSKQICRESPTSHPLVAADWFLLLFVALLQLSLCFVRSRGRLYWADELLGVKLLSDPSFPHMFVGWREGADGGGGLYYLLARLWVDAAGLSGLTLRLFSTLGMIVSVTCIWIVGRRYYSTAALAFGIALVFFTAPSLLWQTVNGRFYGLLLASVALASVIFLRTAEKENVSIQDLSLTACVHALMCGSHILGMVYSAPLLLATMALDRVRGRWRPQLYLAALAGWIVLPFSYRAILSSTSVTSTSFWTQKPGWVDLVFAIFAFGKIVAAVGVPLLIYVLIAAFTKRGGRAAHQPEQFSKKLPIYMLVASLFLAELILFTKSRLGGISIFADRYLIPECLATVLLLAELFSRLFSAEPAWEQRHVWRATSAGLLVLIPCGLFGFSRHPNFALYPSVGLAQRIDARLPEDPTVVVTALPLYVFLRFYDQSHRYIYLLDWNYDLAADRVKGDHSGERLMENWKRAGYDTDSILTCDQILQQNPSFTILLFGSRMERANRRLAPPAYKVEALGDFTEWFPFTIWHATRVGQAPSCK